MKLGDKVKYTENGISYLGTIVGAKDDTILISVPALGKVVSADKADVSTDLSI